MSSAEHLIENLILGMKQGRDPGDILKDKCNVSNLSDTTLSADDAIMIACHVVYSLYDGKFPNTDIEYTNYDYIQDMNEEGLAWEMQKLMHCNGCPLFRDGENKCFVNDFTCRDRIVEWLKEEHRFD